MRFTDVAEILVESGKGGNGSLSFRREKFVPKGGPDGGDGGRGGNIFLVADERIQTLADFEYQRRFTAGNGTHGKGGNRHGASGEDVNVPVPCGTLVIDPETGSLFADLTVHGDIFLAARGGRGGKGNARFTSSRRRVPRFSENGVDGEKRTLRLELKMLADVGLVGLPNAGKSSLLSAISGAKPDIAGYPFTTLSPNLGILAVESEKIVIADVPGLIEGAHLDKGLGHAFLRHIERTRLIVYVIDISEGASASPVEQWRTIRNEFNEYNPELLNFLSAAVGNKTDLPYDKKSISVLRKEIEGAEIPFFETSAVTGEGIHEFIRHIVSVIHKVPATKRESRYFEIESPIREDLKRVKPTVKKTGEEGMYQVGHPEIERLIKRFNFDQDEALGRFMALMQHYRIE
ncbi:MAG TPA: GTPase ObgE, partial [Synergistetes bacterium]|nr:GTPase ObgE [Synergistota bacterium]